MGKREVRKKLVRIQRMSMGRRRVHRRYLDLRRASLLTLINTWLHRHRGNSRVNRVKRVEGVKSVGKCVTRQ